MKSMRFAAVTITKRPLYKGERTVWKFKNFPVTQILRETNLVFDNFIGSDL